MVSQIHQASELCSHNVTAYLNGKTELRGGSEQDRAEAREWVSLFWHVAVVGLPRDV
jgi:hypothetical protein